MDLLLRVEFLQQKIQTYFTNCAELGVISIQAELLDQSWNIAVLLFSEKIRMQPKSAIQTIVVTNSVPQARPVLTGNTDYNHFLYAQCLAVSNYRGAVLVKGGEIEIGRASCRERVGIEVGAVGVEV